MKVQNSLAVGALAAAMVVFQAAAHVRAQDPTTSPRTPWGAPDLQGIWGNQEATPFERPAEYGAREFLTDAERAARQKQLDARAEAQKGGLTGFRDQRKERGTEQDIAGAYNAIWEGVPLTKVGKRTSLVVDPPDGKVPVYTPEAKKRLAAQRDYLNMLLRGTSGSGEPGRPTASPEERAQRPPVYNLDRMNREDNPEDNSAGTRCLGTNLPRTGSVGGIGGERQRIVQSPDALAIFWDIGQGGGFSRVIPISARPHLPSGIPEMHGDSRGRWEGNTLVVDTTNFSDRTEFHGSRQNLHLIERFTRTDANTLEYRVTLEDPTTWTKPWTLVIDYTKEDDKANQIYQQTCHEGNYGMIGVLANTRAAEKAFKEGKGPDPATTDIATGGGEGDGNALPPGVGKARMTEELLR
jgi:hypothetical protein